MVFNSLYFLAFFAVLAALLRIFRGRGANAWILLGASLIFYAWWDIRFVPLLFGLACVNFLLGRRISAGGPRRRAWLIIGVALDLGALAFFKYTNFLLSLLHGFPAGGGDSVYINIIAPLGISFFVFEFISCLADIYRGKFNNDCSFLEYLNFVFFFPRLASGPIIRPAAFLPQMRREITVTRAGLAEGAQIFALGLFKKAVVADRLAVCADAVFGSPATFDTPSLWLAVLAYSLQIYCDFSGYSDMAIGIARAMGLQLPLNFNMPYLSKSPTEFWRRWHISLSSWLRDYLYIPLGGNRKGRARTLLNLFVTMLIGGLWHGAGLTFLAWGGLHGLGLIISKELGTFFSRFHINRLRRLRAACGTALTCLFVGITWVFFRSASFAAAFTMLGRMFSPSGGVHYIYAPLFTIALPAVIIAHIAKLRSKKEGYLLFDLSKPLPALCFIFALLGIFFLAADNAMPFIYFQF